MGVSEGKAIGSWFGPNTVSQVLRYEIVCMILKWHAAGLCFAKSPGEFLVSKAMSFYFGYPVS